MIDSEFKAALIGQTKKLDMLAYDLCHNATFKNDLVQETLLRAWKARASYNPEYTLAAWLATIMRNYFFSECRRPSTRLETPYLAETDSRLAPDDSQLTLEAKEVVNLLKSDVMREIAMGAEPSEIAAELGLSAGGIRKRVFTERNKLRVQLNGLDAFARRSRPAAKFRGKVSRGGWGYACANVKNLQADGYDIRVFLNGREIQDWTTADSEAGTVAAATGTGELKGEVEIRLERSAI